MSAPSSPSGSSLSVEPKPQRRDAAKSMFLVAYGATSKTVTQEMMQGSGLCPMECHSLEHDGFKYSYMKLYKRVREGQIKAFMLHAITEHGVEQEDEADMLSKGIKAIVSCEKKSNAAFAEHPAMQRIRAKLASPSSCETALESWKDSDSTKARLIKRFDEEEGGRARKADLRAKYIQLELDNRRLQEKYDAVKKVMRKRRLTSDPDETP